MKAAAGLTIALWAACAACGSGGGGGDRGSIGPATGAALIAAVEAAADTVEPWRCARWGEPPTLPVPAGWVREEDRLRPGGKAAAAARIAIVAEARGADDPTIAALGDLRRALDAAPVDVVVTLGGMGQTRAEIARAIGPLARGAPWLVVAIPGDRESIGEHRAAIAELAGAGATIVDGSEVRLVEIGGATLGTLPGAPYRARLAADEHGCVHDDADVLALLEALAADPRRPAVVLGQRAPRGRTDLAPGGIRAGDVGYARLVAETPVDLVVHAAVDDVSGIAGRTRPDPRKRANPVTTLAAGAIDATPRYRPDGTRVLPSAVVLTVGGRELAWKPLYPSVVP